MRRRAFIRFLGGAAVAPALLRSLAVRAQERERIRRIGILLPSAADDPESLARIAALLQGLQALGWTVGRNVRIDYRWAEDTDRIARSVTELVALAPDVIVANGNPTVTPLLQATSTVPIVFASVADPVGNGFVDNLARPGRNATGFTNFEFSISGKWLELLKQIAPRTARVAILRDASTVGGGAQFGAIQAVAPSFGVEVNPVDARNAAEIERAVTAFVRGSTDGIVVLANSAAIANRDLIIALAARYRMPAVYPFRFFATAGGLASYGPDVVDQYRQAAGYVDRILKGEKPADLPVQAPTKYETVLNLKTARALGVDVPATVLARADEVIE
jgi:putative ABC transport system substrate-binding protein